MSKKTKHMFYLSMLYSVFFSLFLMYGFLKIRDQGNIFNTNERVIAEQNNKEQEYHNLIQITESTKNDRDTLAGFFITEKDTISFISNIENLANDMGITLETSQLSIKPKTKKTEPQLYVGFNFSGSETAVRQLVLLFENIPYHKSIPELVLTRNADDGTWKGSILLYITITS